MLAAIALLNGDRHGGRSCCVRFARNDDRRTAHHPPYLIFRFKPAYDVVREANRIGGEKTSNDAVPPRHAGSPHPTR